MSLQVSGVLTSIAALAAVLGLVLLAGRALRAGGLARLQGRGQRMAVREVLPLDRARSLRIVSCDGRELLLLVGGGSDIVVGWLPGGESVR